MHRGYLKIWLIIWKASIWKLKITIRLFIMPNTNSFLKYKEFQWRKSHPTINKNCIYWVLTVSSLFGMNWMGLIQTQVEKKGGQIMKCSFGIILSES